MTVEKTSAMLAFIQSVGRCSTLTGMDMAYADAFHMGGMPEFESSDGKCVRVTFVISANAIGKISPSGHDALAQLTD